MTNIIADPPGSGMKVIEDGSGNELTFVEKVGDTPVQSGELTVFLLVSRIASSGMGKNYAESGEATEKDFKVGPFDVIFSAKVQYGLNLPSEQLESLRGLRSFWRDVLAHCCRL